MRPFRFIAAAAALCLCAVQMQAAGYSILCPPRLHNAASPLPLVVQVPDAQYGFNRYAFDSLHFDNPELERTSITVRRGAGTLLTSVQAQDEIALRLPVAGDTVKRTVPFDPDYPTAEYSGTLEAKAYTWDSTSDRIITGDLVIPDGAELTIGAGTLVRLHKHASIIVRGRLNIRGEIQAPVAFLPEKAGEPWGSLVFENSQSLIIFCIFSGGGGDATKPFGHSGSQPVFMATNSHVQLFNSYFVYNPGKAFGSSRSNLLMNNVLISNCDTGGEFNSSVVTFEKSLVMDIPDGDGTANDDDNDGFYFAGVKEDAPDAYSILNNTTISLTEDDCVDHNGARIQILNSILERGLHEGLAASNGQIAVVINSIVQECEQGIESGYGNPAVLVDHCIITNNGTGLRFGDFYDEPSAGSLRATNSLVYNNGDNIQNFDPQLNGPLAGALSVAYCMTNDPDFDDSTGCITGTPIFESDSIISASSPGFRAGIAGSSMGLFPPGTGSISITELFSESPAGGSGDWLEIHNASPLPFSPASWRLKKDEQSFVFPQGTVIPAHGYLVVCRDTSVFRSRYSHPLNLVGNLPFVLGHAGPISMETVVDAVIESVPYASEAPWPARNEVGSIFLPDPFLDNSEGENWENDPTSGGTPGYYRYGAITSAPEPHPTDTDLRITPQPFGSHSTLSFTLTRPGDTELLVYNAVGTRLRTLHCGHMPEGYHTIPVNTRSLPAGALYFALKIDGRIVRFAGGIHHQND